MSSRFYSLKKGARVLSLAGILAASSMYSCATTTHADKAPEVAPPVAAVVSVKQDKKTGQAQKAKPDELEEKVSPPPSMEIEIQEAPAPWKVAKAALQVGDAHARRGNAKGAVRAYRKAIGTGALNHAGRILAYWNLSRAERDLGDTGAMCDDLGSFVTYAQDFLGSKVRSDAFVEGFGLIDKLNTARGTLSCEWSRKNGYFGRSESYTIPVHTEDEIIKFFDCLYSCEFRELDKVSIGEGSNISKVIYNCYDSDEVSSEEFYFELLK